MEFKVSWGVSIAGEQNKKPANLQANWLFYLAAENLTFSRGKIHPNTIKNAAEHEVLPRFIGSGTCAVGAGTIK